MVEFKLLDGETAAVNAATVVRIERLSNFDEWPETLVTFVDGDFVFVNESYDDVLRKLKAHQAR